jgi:hypothetical protein
MAWQQEDGVAKARAGTEHTLSLASTPDTLAFSLDMKTVAFAAVGPCPAYPAARGVAEAWFDYALFQFTLSQPAQLTVAGARLGDFGPGVHPLPPGEYVLELKGPSGLSWVSVGQSSTGQSGSDFAASFRVAVAPAPSGGLALLAGLGAISRPRRR